MARRRVLERDAVVTIRASSLWMPNQSLPFFVAFLIGIVASAVMFGGGGLPLLVCQLPAIAVVVRIVRGRLVLRPDDVVIANVLRDAHGPLGRHRAVRDGDDPHAQQAPGACRGVGRSAPRRSAHHVQWGWRALRSVGVRHPRHGPSHR